MDADTMKRKDDYRKVLGDFRAGKTDILIGTQMIAKGLHFPNVTLVGIIYADLALHQPDFRAGERTFQLLTQVAGRAGRGDVEGEVFVQAFSPFHPAIQYRAPPRFHRLLRPGNRIPRAIEISARQPRGAAHPQGPQRGQGEIQRRTFETRAGKATSDACNRWGERTREPAGRPQRRLARTLAPPRINISPDFKDLIIAGPAPAPLLRAEQFYRYQIMLRTRAMSKLSQALAKIIGSLALPDDVTLAVDIDPVNLG